MKKVICLLPIQPDVQQVTLNFEKAIWKALRSVLPTVKLQSCIFYWRQALWRRVSSYQSIILVVEGNLTT